MALGELGVVKKRRRVYCKDKLRIHLDEVDNIGIFIEFAVSVHLQCCSIVITIALIDCIGRF